MALLNEFVNVIDINRLKKNQEDIQTIEKGQVWMVELPTTDSSVQQGKRPFLITQNEKASRFSSVVTGFAITSKMSKAKLPTHIEIQGNKSTNGLFADSVILVEQPLSISKKNLTYKMGYITEEEMKLVEEAIKVQFDIREEKIIDINRARDLMKHMMNMMKVEKTTTDYTNQLVFKQVIKDFNKQLENIFEEVYNKEYKKYLEDFKREYKAERLKKHMANNEISIDSLENVR